jgi:putative metal-binding protein
MDPTFRSMWIGWLAALSCVSLAPAAVETVTILRRPPINQYCPIDNVDFDLTFVAEQPYARLTIEAFNRNGGGTWIQNRLDNIAVIDKASYDAHVVVTPGFQGCYAWPGDPNAPALDFNASSTTEAHLALFDTGTDGWVGTGTYFLAEQPPPRVASAPRDPALGTDTSGGALGFGETTAGNVIVRGTILVPNLTPGTQYIVTGWWYVEDTSRPLTITIDTLPCSDKDSDGLTDCDGDCGAHDAAVKPGAVERCDGVDNDCDGQVDEDAPCDRTCDAPQLLVSGARLTTTTPGSTRPSLVWTRDRYVAIFADFGSFISRASLTGSTVGAAHPLIGSPEFPPSTAPRAAWTGSEIAVLNRGLYDRAGRPLGVSVGSGDDLVWTGKEYGLIGAGSGGVGFSRRAPDGTSIASGSLSATSSTSSRIAWNGASYGAVWLGGGLKFRLIAPLDIASGQSVDVGSAGGVFGRAIAAGDGTFGIAWSDNRNGDTEIYFARFSSEGIKLGPELRVTNSAGASIDPAIAWSGSEWGIVWGDTRTGNEEIWFARIDATGVKVGSDFQVTNAPGHSRTPSIVWAGGKYGIAWSDDRETVNDEIYFTVLGCDCMDGDGDGASSCVDCADTDASIYPGAPSPCDGTTNLDCNSAYWPSPAPFDDLDGDGFSPCEGDCDEAAASVYPGAAETCDGVITNCNTPSWPSVFGTLEIDSDADGFMLCENDCSDVNPNVWAIPSEVPLHVHHDSFGQVTVQVTQAPAEFGGISVAYDILRSEDPGDFDVSDAFCLRSDGTSVVLDPAIPALGRAYFYLARADNACGGTLGTNSAGVPRVSRTCP